jgi:hypothetical protein
VTTVPEQSRDTEGDNAKVPADGPSTDQPAAVAFLDLIGFSDVEPRAAFTAMAAVRDQRPPDDNPGWKRRFYPFADSCILVVPKLIPEAEVKSTLLAAAMFVQRAITVLLRDHGLLVSGSLTYGSVAQRADIEMPVGAAVTRAHELLVHYATIPRVVLDSRVMPLEWSARSDRSHALSLLRLADDVTFLDYLYHPPPALPLGRRDPDWTSYFKLLDGSRAALLRLASTARTPGRLAKCAWAVQYHNRSVRRAMSRCPDERAELERRLISELDAMPRGSAAETKEEMNES